MNNISFNIYPSILDKFTSYLKSEVAWETYYGASENPKISIDDYEKQKFEELINGINRVPFDSEAADKGTAFNEVIDMLILGRSTSETINVNSDRERGVIVAKMAKNNDRVFTFPIDLCRFVADYYKYSFAVPQLLVNGELNTRYGVVNLYGYIDELLPRSIEDIKTTSKYFANKFRDNWQHHVYPYCVVSNGGCVESFSYRVVEWGTKENKIYEEFYKYDHELSTQLLTGICERFIEFLYANRELITDKKIFNQQ